MVVCTAEVALQPLNCQRVRTAQSVKDADGTAQPLVLDALRRACYLPTESMDVADPKTLQELDSVSLLIAVEAHRGMV